MKIVVVGSYRYQMYAPAFANGFRRLGHDVIELDYELYHLSGKGLISSFFNRFQDRYHIGMKMWMYNTDLEKIVKTEKPDMVFLYRCYHIFLQPLKE